MENSLILFGVGSPLTVDVEESCWRLGIRSLVGVRNVPGPIFMSESLRVLGVDELTDVERSMPCLIPIFTPGHRRSALDAASLAGLQTSGRIIDPTAVMARSCTVGEGSYINAGCVLAAAVTIGEQVIINRASSIGHHSTLSDWCSIGPGVTLAGLVKVGRGVVVGAGVVVLPDMTIGSNSVIAAGSVVTRSVPDHCLVAGNPARVIKRGIRGYRNLTVGP